MQFDHVALASKDIAADVRWYVQRFGAAVLYQDASWAFLNLGGHKLALVNPRQHPPHLALSVREDELTTASQSAGIPIQPHRDGSKGIYLHDPSGNAVELIVYPPTAAAQRAAEPPPTKS